MEEKKDVYILAIESSCDETAAAVVKNGRGQMVTPTELSFLGSFEVGIPVIIHHPRVDMRPFVLFLILKFTEIYVS